MTDRFVPHDTPRSAQQPAFGQPSKKDTLKSSRNTFPILNHICQLQKAAGNKATTQWLRQLRANPASVQTISAASVIQRVITYGEHKTEWKPRQLPKKGALKLMKDEEEFFKSKDLDPTNTYDTKQLEAVRIVYQKAAEKRNEDKHYASIKDFFEEVYTEVNQALLDQGLIVEQIDPGVLLERYEQEADQIKQEGFENYEAPPSTPPAELPFGFDEELWKVIWDIAKIEVLPLSEQQKAPNEIEDFAKHVYMELYRIFQVDITGEQFRQQMEMGNKVDAEDYQAFKTLGDYLIKTYDPKDFIYLLPGGSLIGMSAYLKQAYPEVRIVYMPVSGLSDTDEQAQERAKHRKMDSEQTHIFMQNYLGPHLSHLKNGNKLLLADYSSSGSTVNKLSIYIGDYLKAVGIPQPGECVVPFKFNRDFTETFSSESAELPNLRLFIYRLKGEHYKAGTGGKSLILYEKKGDGSTDFTGRLKQRQKVLIASFISTWLQVKEQGKKSNSQQ
ncbi:hypothetical protein [Paenibacillus elgii]|uniref:hypothetical protein n=1 Tax=Paenibacillus elgii TaxID=189691 RepID=UPI000492B8B8|nr:hypothetical protein [Paenibacillus elgii]